MCAVLTLTGDDLIVTLDPAQGGRIASIVAFGEERLVSPRLVTRAATEQLGRVPDDPVGRAHPARQVHVRRRRLRDADQPSAARDARHRLHVGVDTRSMPDTMRLDLGDPWPFGGHAIHHGSVEGNTATLQARGARGRSPDAGDGRLAPVVPQAGRPLVHRRRRCTRGTTRTSRPVGSSIPRPARGTTRSPG